MVVPEDKLKLRTYNINAMSFTPEELSEEIRTYIPELKVTYKPDQRQEIGEGCLGQLFVKYKFEIRNYDQYYYYYYYYYYHYYSLF